MSRIFINTVRCERLSEKSERCIMGATVRGVSREIIVNIGRYEKRPVFVIQNVGELCDYQTDAMRALLNQVVVAYTHAETENSMTISETL